ncbi:hypothetical protein J6590_107477, partial [Homalodisca vitripennis]
MARPRVWPDVCVTRRRCADGCVTTAVREAQARANPRRATFLYVLLLGANGLAVGWMQLIRPLINSCFNSLLLATRQSSRGSLLAGLYLPDWAQQKPMCHLNMGNLKDVHQYLQMSRFWGTRIFDSSSLLREMTVNGPQQGCATPACFDWRGWFGGGLPFFRGDITEI